MTAGVNVIGYLSAELGLGEVARALVLAAEGDAIPVSTVDYARTGSRRAHVFAPRTDARDARVNVVCVNADELPRLDRGLFAERYSAGVWFWEVDRFPEELHPSFALVDEVWVASEFVRDALEPVASTPVLVFPMPLVARDSDAHVPYELPDAFRFLFTFDFFSVLERKNPLGLIDAFGRAFAPGEGPVLVLKTINGDRMRPELERVRAAIGDRDDVLLLDGYVDADDRDAITAACDCYVSLHRSEGYGLTLAEAMLFGKPVVATGYSGNRAFMDDGNSHLVRYHLVRVGDGRAPYPADAEWAEPDLDHAAQLLREVYERPDEARALGRRARDDLLRRFPPERTAAFIRERMTDLPRHDRLHRAVRGPLERAAAFVAAPPGTRLAGGVRGVLRRMLWPQLAAQRETDGAIVEAVRGLERVSREELDRLSALEARLDALEQSLYKRPPDSSDR